MFERSKRGSKLLIVGEAPGEEEVRQGRPFVGSSGQLLNHLLAAAGFEREDWNITNVFTQRPPSNELKAWTLTKTELKKLGYGTTARLPQLGKRYIHPDYEGEVARLHEEIRQLQPSFILMLGGTALWALTGESRITVSRGTIQPLHLGALPQPQAEQTPPSSKTSSEPSEISSLPVSQIWGLATFHPAMVLRQWDNRPLVWADLIKTKRFLQSQLPPPLARRLWLDPSLEEIEQVYQVFKASPTSLLGVDIETDPRCGQITTISFGTETEAICIPFFNKATLPALANYWKTAAEEAEAWRWVMRYAALPNPKVGQNFLYDHQYLLEDMDIRVRNVNDDTSILQHVLQPELPKALGTLASLYLNEPSWKLMRTSDKDEAKADD